jgi:hypothetical protein
VHKLWARDADPAAEYNANVEVRVARQYAAEIRSMVGYVFATLRAEQPNLRVIVVLDAPRPGIYEAPNPATDLGFLSDIVREAAEENDFAFLDLAEPMRAAFRSTGVRFESPYDGHWDAHGHRFVADQLLQYLH